MNIRQLAERQLENYDRRQPGECFGEPGFSMSISEAYDLQFAVADLRMDRGEKLAGYKIGCISRTMQTQLGLDRPVFGHVWESELHPSGVTLKASAFAGLAIEGELAVGIARDVRADAVPADIIDAAFAIVELHHYTFRGGQAIRAAELIANNAIHAGVVLPTVQTAASSIDQIIDEPLSVRRGAELLGEATARDLEGGVLGGIQQLVNYLAVRGRHLHQRQLVLTGSPLPLWRVAPRDEIVVRCQRLGGEVRVGVVD